jgi:hypothetical protein
MLTDVPGFAERLSPEHFLKLRVTTVKLEKSYASFVS